MHCTLTDESAAIATSKNDDHSIGVGLPAFLVITLFCPIDGEEDFFIGKQSHAERAQSQGKPFVRVVSQHLARTVDGKERRLSLIQRLEDRFRGVFEAKNCEWEVSTCGGSRSTDGPAHAVRVQIAPRIH